LLIAFPRSKTGCAPMDLHKNASQLGQVDLFHGEDHTMTNYIKNYIKNHSKLGKERDTPRARRSQRLRTFVPLV
jgi:hypothetical protein